MTSRQLVAVDEPNMKIGRALDGVLQRWDRRIPRVFAADFSA